MGLDLMLRRKTSLRFLLAGIATFTLGLMVLGFAVEHQRPALAADGQPAKKDSNPRIRPKEVTATPSASPIEAKAGETITYKVEFKLEPSWHIYKFAKKPFGEGLGPRNTTFDFFDTAGLKLVGTWTPAKAPISKQEPFFNNEVIEYYEDEATWSIKLEVPEGTAPGKKVLRCQAGYQICNDNSCKQPGQWTLPDVEVTILPGGGAAAAPATPAPAVVASEKPAASGSAEAPPATASTSSPSAPSTAAAVTSEKSAEPVPAAAAAAPNAALATPSVTSSPASAATSSSGSSSALEPVSRAAKAAPVSEVAREAERGLIPFLLFSAGGGLLALVMPCVWPMVPITVNFFVKQGHHNKGKTTGLAVAYCLAIIGVFTTFGVLVSFFFSAAALQNLANNPWLNTGVALLFLAFGLSLLGLFEIRLPNFLLNASARGESRGGLVGVMFMALTLTITSFTCTFPVVGGLIVMAAGGQFFYPIIGLATFSGVLALPFFLLALAPGLMSKMPKSGDWMNTVKVVGGLVEIGAALKFVNTAELGFGTVPEDAWFDAPLVLSIWVGLAAVCGLYLLGIFRTDHDHEQVRVGPGRLVTGSLFLALALFLAPALFGHPPKSPFWDLLVGLLPADVKDLESKPQVVAAAGCEGTVGGEIKAKSSDPATAEREEKTVHGVQWGMSFDGAREQAKAAGKPVLIDFTGVNCVNCRKMEATVLPRSEVVKLLSQFVTVQLYTDFVPIASIGTDARAELAEKNQNRLLELANETTNPFYVVLGADGEVLASKGGYVPPDAFVKFLEGALGKYSPAKTAGKDEVAQMPSDVASQ